MIKAIVVDDEPYACQALVTLLERHCPDISVEAVCHNGKQAITAVRDNAPQLVFLDIEMPHMNGFELLEALAPVRFHVVFTTSYDQYAIKAIRFSALDYLLKPIDPDDLVQSVARLQQKISNEETVRRIETLFQNLHGTEGLPKKLSVPTPNGFLFVEVGDIVRCQSHINYTSIFLKDGRKLTVAKTLKEFEELLCGHHFFRVHNSHLVNLACIKSYNRGKGGFVSMSDHTDIEVSMRRKEELLRKLSAMAVQKRLS